MNKIFIIGNGFDLAHGLPTSYNHFIDDFWKKIKTNYTKKETKEIILIDENNSGFFNYASIKTYEDFIRNIEEHNSEYNHNFDKKNHIYFKDKAKSQIIFKFKNDFFKNLNIYKKIHNWVDVENLYYLELKNIAKAQKKNQQQTDEGLLAEKNRKVYRLNKEFEQIKVLFINYMKEEVLNKYDFSDKSKSLFWTQYYNILTPFSIHNDNMSSIGFEFSSKADVEELENLYADQREGSFFNTALFLCFNYTPTIQTYFSLKRKEAAEIKLNYIHNSFQNETTPIIFGFGDEIDKDYKLIENLDNNNYLKNFKSFQYLQNSNYNKLLDYINFIPFQVIILGHSCGLSDRVLLNTIFEHENCRSIKVYYHKSNETDNYTDIVQNISRHFSHKPLMRSRVVNKEYSKPMIQVQIPKIE